MVKRNFSVILPVSVFILFCLCLGYFKPLLFPSYDYYNFFGISWHMYVTHDYLHPISNGSIYTDKPPLLFWLIIAIWKLTGPSIISPMILMPVFLLAWLFIYVKIYQSLFGKDSLQAGEIIWLVMSSVFFIKSVHLFRVDIFLITAILLYNLLAIDAFKNKPKFSQFLVYCLCTLSLSLGFFSKGPVVLIYTVLPCVVASIYLRQYRYLKVSLVSLCAAILVLSLWFAPALFHGSSDVRQSYLFLQLSRRLVMEQNRGIFYYLGNILPLMLLPWVCLLFNFQNIKKSFTKVLETNSGIYLSIVFSISLLIMFCWGQKEPRYMIPSAMLLSLPLFYSVSMPMDNRARRDYRFAYFSVFLLTLAAFITPLPVKNHLELPIIYRYEIPFILALVTAAYYFFSRKEGVNIHLLFAKLFFITLATLFVSYFSQNLQDSNDNHFRQKLQQIFKEPIPVIFYQASYPDFILFLARNRNVGQKNIANNKKQLTEFIKNNPHAYIISGTDCPLQSQSLSWFKARKNYKICEIKME